MPDVDLKYAIGLDPKDAVAYFEAKGLKISGDWHEVLREAHAKAFTVANLSKMDVLQDVHGGLSQALKDGKTERWFMQQLTPLLQAKGWWGKAVDETTGEIIQSYPGTSRPVQYGSPRRLKLIYRTNLQTAYMAGRWKAQAENADHRPYLQYVAVMDSRTRPAHKALNGKVYRVDDAIWQYLYPPNGWNCRCRTRAITGDQVREMGLSIESSDGRIDSTEVRVGQDQAGDDILRPVHRLRYTDPVDGREKYFQPDAGWDYNPGSAGFPHTLELVTQRMNSADNAFASASVAAMVGSPAFMRFYSLPEGNFPIAVLADDDARAIGASTHTVQLSSDTLIKQQGNHPELTVDEYRMVQHAIDEGEMFKDGERSAIYIWNDGGYVVVVKTTTSGHGLWMTSFRRLSRDDAKRDRELARLMKKVNRAAPGSPAEGA